MLGKGVVAPTLTQKIEKRLRTTTARLRAFAPAACLCQAFLSRELAGFMSVGGLDGTVGDIACPSIGGREPSDAALPHAEWG